MSQRLLVRSDLDAFRDALGHTVDTTRKSAFWRRMEDTLLRPSKDVGHASNPQRAVLEAMGYLKLKTAKLARPTTTKCFCCNLTRYCTFKLLSGDGDDAKVPTACPLRRALAANALRSGQGAC
jgi:hypothetical protein